MMLCLGKVKMEDMKAEIALLKVELHPSEPSLQQKKEGKEMTCATLN